METLLKKIKKKINRHNKLEKYIKILNILLSLLEIVKWKKIESDLIDNDSINTWKGFVHEEKYCLRYSTEQIS